MNKKISLYEANNLIIKAMEKNINNLEEHFVKCTKDVGGKE